jgi:hypothetical protein
MAFATDVATACERIGNTTYKAAIDTAVDTFEAAVKAQVVTAAGRTEADAAYVAIQEAILDVTRLIAEELADTTD